MVFTEDHFRVNNAAYFFINRSITDENSRLLNRDISIYRVKLENTQD